MPSASAAPLVLPPSLVDVDSTTPETEDTIGSSSSSSSVNVGGGVKRQASPGVAKPVSLVPTRIRTGLMASHDDPPPVSVERPVAQLLAAELEAYERACAPPTAEEWEAYVNHEEHRLEERCADLIASLMPSLPSPPLMRRRDDRRGFVGAGEIVGDLRVPGDRKSVV